MGFLLWGGPAYGALLTLMAVIGYDEYIRMNGIGRKKPEALIGFAGVLCLLLFSFQEWSDRSAVDWVIGHPERLVWLLLFLFFAVTVLSKNKTTIDQIALLFLGVFYIGIGFRYMMETRSGADGLYWTLFVFLCIWASDAGAYFVGRMLGKHKLWPEISPNKTIEGAVGGIVITMIVAICFHFGRPELLDIGRAISLGIIISIVGMLGDLMQSAYKRVKGIKDTGTLLPGHGGILDRTDSWLIVFPFLQLLSLLPQ